MHIQTQTEWEEEMAEEVLAFVRSEIYLDLRFFDVAMSALKYRGEEQLLTLATDGRYLYYSGVHVLRVFRENGKYLDRLYLHSLLHCIFSHLWLGGKRDRRLWSLACDIAVEYTIDRLDKPCTRRILSLLRREVYGRLDQGKQISAAVIYRWLEELAKQEPERIPLLAGEFYTDDHVHWPKETDSPAQQQLAQQAKQQWDKLARQTRMRQELSGKDAADAEAQLMSELAAEGSRRSYREFLEKFAVYREEVRLDMDEFDLNYYTYGLQLYGNLPLIEPLESREAHKIQELVIVIDTSESTGGELVKGFLRETFTILRRKESFFQRYQIRLLQCDDRVRMDETLETGTQMEQLIAGFRLAGGGGTDFRPAFEYVEQLQAQGELQNLNGLLYFTDGRGSYPKKRPPYRTAFLFLEDYEEAAVPPWAMRLRLEPEEFTHGY